MHPFPERVAASARHSSFPEVVNGDGDFTRTMFKELLRLPKPKAYVFVILLLLSTSVAFATIYWKFGEFTLHGAALSDEDDKFFHSFLFSLALTTTYSDTLVHPSDTSTLLLANAQAFFVQLLLVFISGIVYILLTSPAPALTASDYLVIDPKRGVVETRFVFKDIHTQVVDARITLTFRRNTVVDGVKLYKFDDLVLRRENYTNLRGMCFVSHAIDVDSPLAGVGVEELKESRAGFDLTVFGNDRATMEPMFEQFHYEVRYGDVLYGEFMFHDLLYAIPGKTNRVLDHSRLNLFVGYHDVKRQWKPAARTRSHWSHRDVVYALIVVTLSTWLVYLVAEDYMVTG